MFIVSACLVFMNVFYQIYYFRRHRGKFPEWLGDIIPALIVLEIAMVLILVALGLYDMGILKGT